MIYCMFISSYFEEIDRIASLDYSPTYQDIFNSNFKTTGVSEAHFQMNELVYR